jgi:hypothetical protein
MKKAKTKKGKTKEGKRVYKRDRFRPRKLGHGGESHRTPIYGSDGGLLGYLVQYSDGYIDVVDTSGHSMLGPK